MSKPPSHWLLYRLVPRRGCIQLVTHVAVSFDGTFRVAGRVAKALRAQAMGEGHVIFYEAMVPTEGVLTWLEERGARAAMCHS
jgi:hypothetical protein